MIRKFSAVLMAMLLVFGVFPTARLSADESWVSYGETVEIGGEWDLHTYNVLDDAHVTFTGSGENIKIVCGSNVTLTIRDLSITNDYYLLDSPITFSGTGNTLLLEGVSTIDASSIPCPGIQVEGTATLTINSTSDPAGSLYATGGGNAAGIGAGDGISSGLISISGGTIDAIGGEYGAGIGGGDHSSCGTISISGGTVDATGGRYGAGIGAGIGGGYLGSVGTINISGGTVDATGGDYGAGIGGGQFGSDVTISISGGTVGATGGYFGAGIGGGNYGSGGAINISGGTIDATGGAYGAGIGGGGTGFSGGTINISGGTIDATGGAYGAGIGGGIHASGGAISISGGTVDAMGGRSGAGIGGGDSASGGTINISGGTVDTIGGEYGAGIGGGNYGSGGAINISGGQVFATSSGGAQDIGLGRSASLGTSALSISGSAAVFLRNDSSLEPVTDHTHEPITALDGGAVYGITVPAVWTPDFGAYLHFNTLSFSANGGTGSIANITDLNGRSVTIPAADDLTRTNYIFSGWNTAADGSGTSFMVGDSYTLSENRDIFAQWRAVPMLSASSESPIEVGESVTLTPNITGGTWDFDATAWARDGYVFTGRSAGIYTITYSVEGQSTTFDLTVIQAATPTPTATPTPIPTATPTATPTSAPTLTPTPTTTPTVTPTVTPTLTPTPTSAPSPTPTPTTTPIIAPANAQGNDGQGVAKTGEAPESMPQIAAFVGLGVALGCGGLLFATRKRRARKASK